MAVEPFEPLQFNGRNGATGEIDSPDEMVIGVGNEEFTAGRGDSAGFVEDRFESFPVAETTFTVTRIGSTLTRPDIEDFDLMVVGVRDIEFATGVGDAERVLKTNDITDSVNISKIKESFSDDGGDRSPRGERGSTD